ncbi:MAG: putative bifunctional diguanylate cyclase/phosphodiesterase [Leptothrix sp. (in: b-proteobacteria)]
MPAALRPSRPTGLPLSGHKRRSGERRRSDRRASVQTSDETIAAQVRARQHMAVMRSLPWAAGAALASSLIVGALTPGVTADSALLLWLVGVVTLLLYQLQAWWAWRHQGQGARRPTRSGGDSCPPESRSGRLSESARPRARRRRSGRVSPRMISALVAHAGVFGALWSLLPGWMLAQSSAQQHSVLAGSITGMLCIGGVTLAALPRAAYSYIAGLTLGLAVTQFIHPTGQLLLAAVQWFGYVAVVVSGVVVMSRTLRARVHAELRAEHQSQLIGLLLRDFEEQGSDLLWEIDERGCLVHVSPHLAEALGRRAADLEGQPLLGLLAQWQEGLSDTDREAASTLHERLTEGQPFRDVLLPTLLKGQSRWWSMTAKPLINERGIPMGWRGVARDVTQARMADRRMAWLAHYDTLTGLTNRAQFRVLLEQALHPAATRKLPGLTVIEADAHTPIAGGAVLCLDLDHFKTVNDTLGHATGDALLVEVARRLKTAVPKGDVVARLGGDEFAVLVRSASAEADVGAAAQRIVDVMSAPCVALGAHVAVRVSIGIARYPQDGSSVDEVMQHADLALYDAKAHAPGSMRFFAARLGEQVRRRLVLERDLREAIDKKQLSLSYQPKVDLENWAVTGFEALLRWNHPEHGVIPPSEFVPVAEESGLILALGEWALQEACREAMGWPEALQVAVNISPVQVMAQNLPLAVERALHASGLPASRLELEITESVFINETRGTVGRLHALRRLGVQIALDDFGTGYSSLAYLRRFPFDTLKIDRAFVREVLISRDARAIVRNILALAKSLRMATVAEGVEEPAQITVLQDEGCDLVQGYVVSRPMPAAEVAPFLRSWAKRPRPVPPEDFELANTELASLAQPEARSAARPASRV